MAVSFDIPCNSPWQKNCVPCIFLSAIFSWRVPHLRLSGLLFVRVPSLWQHSMFFLQGPWKAAQTILWDL